MAGLVLGVLLLAWGCRAAYWWFHKGELFLRIQDPVWYASHSEKEHWSEVQKAIRRGMWGHDTGFIVGSYGDKRWAEWIMARVKPGQDMGCSSEGLCHSASAMRDITNQDAGENADGWLRWWQGNKSKSQIEWITLIGITEPRPRLESAFCPLLAGKRTRKTVRTGNSRLS